MKLVFPGGEHPQVLLGPGVNRIGSDPQANVVIDRPGVRPQHCLLHVTASGVMLEVPQQAEVNVNGRSVDGLIALRSGDAVEFNGVHARLAAIEPAAAVRQLTGEWGASTSANDDPGVTAVRPVLPKFVLRGVTGRVFGRSFPLHGVLTVGRGPECALRIEEPGLSRLHARLIASERGVQVEDVGSSNGSFINGKRVLRGEARPGDEIAFDTVRFQVLAYGAPERHETQGPPAAASAHGKLIMAGLGGLALLAGVVFMLLR